MEPAHQLASPMRLEHFSESRDASEVTIAPDFTQGVEMVQGTLRM
jgi:hypothetical protein